MTDKKTQSQRLPSLPDDSRAFAPPLFHLGCSPRATAAIMLISQFLLCRLCATSFPLWRAILAPAENVTRDASPRKTRRRAPRDGMTPGQRMKKRRRNWRSRVSEFSGEWSCLQMLNVKFEVKLNWRCVSFFQNEHVCSRDFHLRPFFLPTFV